MSKLLSENKPAKVPAYRLELARRAYAAHLRPLLVDRPHLAPFADEIAALAAAALVALPDDQRVEPLPLHAADAWVRRTLTSRPGARLLLADLADAYRRHHGLAAPARGRGRGDGLEAKLQRAALAAFPEAKAVATVIVTGRRGRGLAGLALLPADTPESIGAPLAQEGTSLPGSAAGAVEAAEAVAGAVASLPADTPETDTAPLARKAGVVAV